MPAQAGLIGRMPFAPYVEEPTVRTVGCVSPCPPSLSVRSANRAARAAERSLLVGLRPLLMPSQLQDPPQKIMFVDDHRLHAPGGGAAAEVTDEAVYLGMSVRNAGNGIAVLHGWILHPVRMLSNDHPDPGAFRRLSPATSTCRPPPSASGRA
jgi:hypothetical protein